MEESIRVGGVPEHFNYPLRYASQTDMFSGCELPIQWKEIPGGTGAMWAAMEGGELDVALMLTEGAIKGIVDGKEGQVIGTYVKSPLIWGVHTHHDFPFRGLEDLKGRKIAISRFGSGSHLMAYVFAENLGWEINHSDFVVVNDFEGARKALATKSADYFLWEKYTTKPVVDKGEWKRVFEMPTPWSCFLIIARNEIVDKYPQSLLCFMEKTREAMKALHPETLIQQISKSYQQNEKDVEEWFFTKEWLCEPLISEEMLQTVQEKLQNLGLIENLREADSLVAPICKVI